MSDRLLFCFPFAGGSASFFDELEQLLPSDIKVIKLEYSGHGSRMKEQLFDNFSDLITDLYQTVADTIKAYPSAEYGLLGYSMGCITAVEMLNKIMQDNQLKLPSAMFLSAHSARNLVKLNQMSEEAQIEYIKQKVINFGGIPESLKKNGSFWRMYMPIYSADYQMLSSYRFEQLQIKSRIPATIFYSEEDTPYSEIRDWCNYFVEKCRFYSFNGNHFFIKNSDNCKKISTIISAEW